MRNAESVEREVCGALHTILGRGQRMRKYRDEGGHRAGVQGGSGTVTPPLRIQDSLKGANADAGKMMIPSLCMGHSDFWQRSSGSDESAIQDVPTSTPTACATLQSCPVWRETIQSAPHLVDHWTPHPDSITPPLLSHFHHYGLGSFLAIRGLNGPSSRFWTRANCWLRRLTFSG